jgi:hypothetical protein
MAVHDERVAAGRQFRRRSLRWRWCVRYASVCAIAGA